MAFPEMDAGVGLDSTAVLDDSPGMRGFGGAGGTSGYKADSGDWW